MRTFWGTLIGALIGLLGGVWGVVIGGGIGFLADLVLVDVRVVRACERYLTAGKAPAWLPRDLPRAGAMTRFAAGPSALSKRKVLTALREAQPESIEVHSSRIAERMIVTGGSVPLGREQLIARLAEPPSEQQQETLRRIWEVLEVIDAPRDAYVRLREVAAELGQAPAFIRNELQVPSRLPPAECKLLGVPRDATLSDLRSAYRALAAQFHPDASGGLSDEERKSSERAFIRIQLAYERLVKELESG
jgi:DnaJ-domain-containing protein 1